MEMKCTQIGDKFAKTEREITALEGCYKWL